MILFPLLLLAQAQPGATFTSNTHLIIEEVTVKDRKGKVIEGLKKEDFIVTEDGKPQTIRFFDFEDIDKTVGTSPQPEPLREPTVFQLTQTGIAPEAPGDVRYKDRRLLAIYFDMKTMSVPDQLRALDAAEKFVRTLMSPADLMAIMEYTGAAVEVLQDFTGDRDRLQSILATLIAGEADNTGGNPPGAAASDTGAAFGQDDTEFTIFSTDRNLNAIETAAKMLGTLNEKKTLICFTGGLALNGIDNQAQLRATINDAVRSGVTLWPIDARGLMALPPLGDATQGSQGNANMYTGAASLAVMTNFERSQDTLYTLAEDTGGKAILDSNDLASGIVAAEKAIAGYYILGYYTTNDALDGKFRRVKITRANNTDAKLDYRQGYFAGKVWGKFTAADKERQLEDALMPGDPVTELTIALEVNYFRQNHAEYFTPIMVKIPGSELALARKRGADHTLIDFIGEIKDRHGTTVQNMRDHMDIKLTDATAAEWSKRPIEYDTGYNLLPGVYQIKVLARDAETGRIGTFLGKFNIPNLDRETQSIPITSVVLASQVVPLNAVIATAGNRKKAAIARAVDPLVQNGKQLIPSVTRVFSAQTSLNVYLEAYEPDATTTQPLLVYVTLLRDGKKIRETEVMEIKEGLNPKSHMLPLRLTFPLTGLQTGQYDCEVTVLDPTAQKAAFWQAPIMVIP